MGQSKKKVFVECSALVTDHLSGVGHVLQALLQAWPDSDADSEYELQLLVAYDQRSKLAALNLGHSIQTIPLPDKAVRALRKFNLFPPMDIVFGKGTYIFPNYWNRPTVRSRVNTFVYDMGFITHPEFVESRNRRFLASNVARWVNRSDRVVTDSLYVKGEIIEQLHVEDKKVMVIYNAAVAEDLSMTRNQVDGTKGRYGITGDYLLFVSNIEPRKNLSRLVAAYRALPPSLTKKYKLILIGADGWGNEQILRDITDAQQDGLDIIKVRQFVPDSDLPALYTGATALVHPALYEGFGMTPLEAMAYGTPVAVSDIPAVREVVGDAGIYFDAEDTQAMSAKIKLVLEDETLRKKLSEAGRQRARQFTWDKSVTKLLQCIEELETNV